MTNSDPGSGIQYVECSRDSGVQTNLSCSRCGDAICPNCMVYTPVGSKCPDCASIGGPTMFNVTTRDMVLGILLGGIAAMAIGVLFAVLSTVLWTADIFEGLSSSIWLIVIGIIQFAGTFAVATSLRYIVGNKYGVRLRLLSAVLALIFFVAEIISLQFISTSGVLSVSLSPNLIINFGGIIGFAFGTYYAMERFKI